MIIKIRNVEEDKFNMEGLLALPIQIDPETEIASVFVACDKKATLVQYGVVEYGPAEYEAFELPQFIEDLKGQVHDEQALLAIDYAFVLGYNNGRLR